MAQQLKVVAARPERSEGLEHGALPAVGAAPEPPSRRRRSAALQRLFHLREGRPRPADREPIAVMWTGAQPAHSVAVDAVAHQVRSTLALLSGYSQSLLHLDLDEARSRRFLERISLAADDLAELTGELLALAQGEDEDGPHRQPVSVGALVARLARQLDESVEQPLLVCQVPADLPLVSADPGWIGHVVRNLVRNAMAYAPPSRVTITVSARASDEWVVVTVADDGDGIDAAERRHVFERRFRGRRAVESGSPGSGLGLYLSRRLVEAHGGQIWLDDVGRGTSVSFSLPRLTAEQATLMASARPTAG